MLFSASLAALPAQESSKAVASEPAIRVNVNRVHLSVSVADSQGRFIQGLRREDFRVLDNNQEQPITSFESSREPTQLVLMIENGIADYLLAGLGKSPLAAADAVVSRLAPPDRVAIVTYSNHARLALDFTTDKVEARRVIKGLYFQLVGTRTGSSSLNLTSSLAAALHWLDSVRGSKTIILFSTGIDTSAPQTLRIAREKVVTSDVRILALSVFGNIRKPTKGRRMSPDERDEWAYVKQNIAEADQRLQQLSRTTGGRVYIPKNPKEFERAYAEVSQFVHGEYVLGFVPPALDGKLHSIRVKVKHPWSRIHHRQAYLAPTPSP